MTAKHNRARNSIENVRAMLLSAIRSIELGSQLAETGEPRLSAEHFTQAGETLRSAMKFLGATWNDLDKDASLSRLTTPSEHRR